MKFNTILLIIYVTLVSSEETIDIRAYTLNNNVNLFLQFVPHMAIQVRTCDNINELCNLTTYGKAKNGKIYSPDILTEGRQCSTKKCKQVPSGYNIKNITDWKTVSKNKFTKFVNEYDNNDYNFINNNCATFVTNIFKNVGLNFSCKIGIVDFPMFCK